MEPTTRGRPGGVLTHDEESRAGRTRHWVRYTERGDAYTKAEDENPMQPILVVQVADKVKGEEMAAAILAIHDALGSPLGSSAFAQRTSTTSSRLPAES